ncbi:MAG: hypothetical protein HOB34_09205 [Nitrospina sp.]|jgi:hypothetical protein|nr:hypothetical protein [Nitrospina sp.]
MANIEELRRQIDSGALSIEGSNPSIETGIIKNNSGARFEYTSAHGWDILSSHHGSRRVAVSFPK